MLKHLQQVGRSLRKEPTPQPKVVEFRAPPPPPDFRNLTERNLDTTTGMLKSLDDAERKLEAEIAERQERLVHIRRSQRAFSAAEQILKEGEKASVTKQLPKTHSGGLMPNAAKDFTLKMKDLA